MNKRRNIKWYDDWEVILHKLSNGDSFCQFLLLKYLIFLEQKIGKMYTFFFTFVLDDMNLCGSNFSSALQACGDDFSVLTDCIVRRDVTFFQKLKDNHSLDVAVKGMRKKRRNSNLHNK